MNNFQRYALAILLSTVLPLGGLYFGFAPAFAMSSLLFAWWVLDTRRRFSPACAAVLLLMTPFVGLGTPAPFQIAASTIFGFALTMDRVFLKRPPTPQSR